MPVLSDNLLALALAFCSEILLYLFCIIFIKDDLTTSQAVINPAMDKLPAASLFLESDDRLFPFTQTVKDDAQDSFEDIELRYQDSNSSQYLINRVKELEQQSASQRELLKSQQQFIIQLQTEKLGRFEFTHIAY